MSTENPLSPLLRACLEFLGMVRRWTFSMFLEIGNIFRLRLNAGRNGASFPVGDVENSSLTPESEIRRQNNNQDPSFSVQIAEAAGSGIDKPSCKVKNEISITVIDRSADGTARQVRYVPNQNTLKILETLDMLKIPYENEIYKPKLERLTVNSHNFYCKNLFLKDRKGQFYLVICHEEYNMDLKQLRKSLNAYRNFNFGTSEDMQSILGTEPGGVTPLALTNPNAADVKMVIHKSLMKEESFLMFHPLDGNLATKITLPCLLRYLKSCNHSVTFVKF